MTKRFDLDVGKRRARNRLREFIKTARIFNRKGGQVLCFPGEQGWEIEQIYRKLEIPDHNIWGVERDKKAAKAIRERYPEINLFEGDLIDFVRSYEGPPFTIISLDYCGNLAQDKIAPLGMLVARDLIADRAVVAMNVMAGREDAEDQEDYRAAHAKAKIAPLFEHGAVDIMDAMKAIQEANQDSLKDARDQALTQALTAHLGYLVPSLRACHLFDLKKSAGTVIRLQQDSVVLRDEDDGKLVMKNVKVEDGPNKIMQAQAIKHEAIMDINKQLESWGVIEAAYNSDDLGIPFSFFKYHLGRTLVMAWFDRWGQPNIPVRIDRISYVSDSGKRMLSDYIEVQKFDMSGIRDAIAPFAKRDDEADHIFKLSPDPSGFPTMTEYLRFLKKIVVAYAETVGACAKVEPSYWSKRVDLGGGEAIQVNEQKMREKVVRLVLKGKTTEEIADKVPFLSIASIRAIRAHVTMGSYAEKAK